MSQETLISSVTKVFEAVLEHTNFSLSRETTAADVDGWDSVTHIMIISEIEKTFKIEFDLMDLMDMDNVGDLLDTIEKEISEN
ncbi:acyl carrier protein [Spongiivirga sp. MCCC 1A20706]|uniref:acyl carrier protein n=1 Tax=Spongiivirga sp. MCCC 1A20706 TaxID=3160963 RepID=UPI0039778E2E